MGPHHLRWHNQSNAIDFINTIIDKFPFRIREVRTDNGHEFQAKFHWHVEDQGIRHAYIKPASPQLNGKVERSHRTDEQEFYQLLTYTDDVDLRARLSEWEQFVVSHEGLESDFVQAFVFATGEQPNFLG